jgi:hypothetical protein
VRINRIIASMRDSSNFGFVGLIGVQFNQYPRSPDIARPLRAAGINVVIGVFYVSSMLAMFPQLTADLQTALDLDASLFAGEAEGRMDEVLRDAAAGKLKAIYNFINDLPALEGAVRPFLWSIRCARHWATSPPSMLGAAAHFNAHSERSSRCGGVNAVPTTSSTAFARTMSKGNASTASSLPTTISLATEDWEPILDRIINCGR